MFLFCSSSKICYAFYVIEIVWQASGLAIFCAGIWMQVELHKYLELNVEYSNVTPYILVGTGAFILLVSSLACCCTVKGHPSLLYTVSACGRNENIFMSKKYIKNVYINHIHFTFLVVSLKYGGFLAFILFVELCIAASMYAYKDRLANGFDKGLEDSMRSNSIDDPLRNIDFNWMQRKVNIYSVNFQFPYHIYDSIFIFHIWFTTYVCHLP